MSQQVADQQIGVQDSTNHNAAGRGRSDVSRTASSIRSAASSSDNAARALTCSAGDNSITPSAHAMEGTLLSRASQQVDGMSAGDADQVGGKVGVEQVCALPLAGEIDGLLQMAELDGAQFLGHLPLSFSFRQA